MDNLQFMSSDGFVTVNLHETLGSTHVVQTVITPAKHESLRRREIILCEQHEQKQFAFIPIYNLIHHIYQEDLYENNIYIYI